MLSFAPPRHQVRSGSGGYMSHVTGQEEACRIGWRPDRQFCFECETGYS